jgi:phosphohistidine phosphatase
MLLFFLRHGDASSDPRYDDIKRPLTDLGIRQATQVGTFLHRMDSTIELVLSSPLKRAQETASCVLSTMKKQQIITSEFLLNGSDPRQLFEQLHTLSPESVLLVGHEPHVSETISLLISGNRKVEIEIRKCSLALVESSIPIRKGAGLLKLLIPVEIVV